MKYATPAPYTIFTNIHNVSKLELNYIFSPAKQAWQISKMYGNVHNNTRDRGSVISKQSLFCVFSPFSMGVCHSTD